MVRELVKSCAFGSNTLFIGVSVEIAGCSNNITVFISYFFLDFNTVSLVRIWRLVVSLWDSFSWLEPIVMTTFLITIWVKVSHLKLGLFEGIVNRNIGWFGEVHRVSVTHLGLFSSKITRLTNYCSLLISTRYKQLVTR